MIEILGKLPWSKQLDQSVIRAIATISRRRTFGPGQVIFQRGDKGDDMYVVVSGRVRLSVMSPEGRELALRHAGPGGLIGEMAVLTGMLRSADATSSGDVEVLAIGRRDFDRVIAAHPVVAKTFIEILCSRLAATTEQLETIALYGLEARLARLLLRLSKAEADDGTGGPLIASGLTQSEIADLIGASRPKVNQALVALAKRGAIRRKGRNLQCNLVLLTAIADGAA